MKLAGKVLFVMVGISQGIQIQNFTNSCGINKTCAGHIWPIPPFCLSSGRTFSASDSWVSKYHFGKDFLYVYLTGKISTGL